MKPLFLSVSAFGPYADTQELDFTCLGDRQVFLIHGPTGSGKSSLLDALCFALYGDTSGGEKDVKSVRSDFSRPDEETFVRFDFRLGERMYRISRSPEQERPKKRGEGVTRQAAQATLWAVKGGETTVLADRWGRVTEEITRITGFDVHQFRQVVVLPQGQFRKFLLAGSADRQVILETLFRTGRYRDIEEALKEAAKELKKDYEDLKRRRTLLLENENADSDDILNERFSAMDDTRQTLSKQISALDAEEKTARNALDLGREARRILTEAQEAEKALEQILSRKEAVEITKRERDRAVKAAGLADADIHVRDREREHTNAAGLLKKAETNARKAHEALLKARAALDLEQARKDEIARDRSRLSELQTIRERLAAVIAAEKDLETARNLAESLDQAFDRQTRDLEKLAREKSNLIEKLDTARQSEGREESLAIQQRERAKQVERLTERDALLKQIDPADQARLAAKDELTLSEQTHSREKEALEALEARYRSGQAAVLARSLDEGLPCPVCGSTHHPSKAASAEDIPDEARLKEARLRVKRYEETLAKQRDLTAKKRETWLALVTRFKALAEDLGPLADADPETLKTELEQLGQSLDEARRHKASISELTGALERLNAREIEARTGLEKTLTDRDKARHEKARWQALVEERSQGIPDPLRDPNHLDALITETCNRISTWEKAFETAQNHRESCQNAKASADQALTGANEALSTSKAAFKKAVETFDRRLSDAGFTGPDDYMDAVRPPDIREVLEKTVRDYGESKKAAEERLERARAAAKGIASPDIPALENRVSALAARLTEARSEETRLISEQGRVKKVLAALSDLFAKSERLDKDYGQIGQLADVATGRGINTSGITFQRYVLAALFDDVLYAAGDHLKAMSRNRFDLEREKDRSDRRTAGGLDLRVMDAHTGTTRPVSTLSGGESFLASLSLALGLADVVQSYAGGIKLDTIFVDEGFGTLDPETLDLAFRAFADLQTKGRLVGIISHVPELKERIGTRLAVVPGSRGSSARFVL